MDILLLQNINKTNSFTRNFIKNETLDGTLKEGSDVLTPSFLIEHANPAMYNEIYIPAFGRYYFIECENVRNNLWLIKAIEVDVLYSFKDQILNQTAIIDKQEKNYNKFIDDGSYISQVNTFPEIVNFSSGFNDTGEFVLITAGA